MSTKLIMLILAIIVTLDSASPIALQEEPSPESTQALTAGLFSHSRLLSPESC